MILASLISFLALSFLNAVKLQSVSSYLYKTTKSPFVTARRSLFMKTIVVFGGTGKTGGEVCYQALKGGNRVYVLARDSSKMVIPKGSGGESGGNPFKDPNLTVIEGSVTDPVAVSNVFEQAGKFIDGVVVALGGKTKDVGKTMLTDGTRNVIYEMKKRGIKRVAVVTSIGTGDSEKQAPIVFKALMYTVMKSIFKDKNNQEGLFIGPNSPGHDLEWCLVRPGGLGEGAPTGVINVIDGQAGSIQRADVANFCLGAILDSNFPYLRKTPCISSTGGTGWVKQPELGFDGANKAQA